MASDLQMKPMNAPAPAASAAAAAKPAAPSRKEQTDSSKSFQEELNRPSGTERGDRPGAKPAEAKVADGKPLAPKDARDPGAKADAAGQKAPTDQKITQPLKKAATQAKQAVEANASLNFLQGKFEKLTADQIPGLVEDNEFISDAIGDDVLQFLAKPASISDLIDSLDLPQSLRDEAEKLGLDLSQVITPNDFLKAIGVDPQRVFNELKFLKENIGVEGLVPAMQAATMMTKGPVGPALAGEHERGSMPAAPAVMPAIPGAPGLNNLQLQQAQMQQAAGAAAPGAVPGNGVPRPAVGNAAPAVSGPGLNPQAPSMMTPSLSEVAGKPSLSTQSLSQPTDLAGVPQQLMENFVDVQSAPKSLLTPTDPAALSAPMSDLAAGTNAAPKMNAGTFDPYAAMGMRLGASNVDTKNLNEAPRSGKEAALQSLEESLVSLQMQRPAGFGQPVTAAALEGAPALAQTAMPNASALGVLPIRPEVIAQQANAQAVNAATPLTPHWDAGAANPFVNAGMLGNRGNFQDAMTLKPDMSSARPADELRLIAPSAFADQAAQGRDGKDSGKDSSSGFDQGKDNTNITDMMSGLADFKPQASHSHAPAFSSLLKTDATELTSADKAALTQQIFERASMLQKDGGGIVKLDLNTEHLGRVEMAVSLEDNRLDLRVIAGSDRVREAMNTELNQLRNALSVQNIQLGNVEVGVGGRQQQSFGSFSEQQRERKELAEIGSIGKAAASRGIDNLERMGVRKPLPTAFANSGISTPYNAAGRLEVRV